MSWEAHRVVLRLRSPMHIGYNKSGNVQLTRPYVTGRVLWGALTLRLTRDEHEGKGPATRFEQYQALGDRVHDHLAYTYFFPTTDLGGQVTLWPWTDRERFRARFLSAYASTALNYPQQSADEGTLHEVEFISPRTLDTGQPIYLAGYLIARQGASNWQSALSRLQLGGERGYGWGRVELMPVSKVGDDERLFGLYQLEKNGWPPLVKAREEWTPLLAHTLAREADHGIEGEVEPLVGREVDRIHGRFGVHFSAAQVCYLPGGRVRKGTRLRIGHFGIWELA